eukprot:361440-Chlamydomonas_euryale.AAC.5
MEVSMSSLPYERAPSGADSLSGLSSSARTISVSAGAGGAGRDVGARSTLTHHDGTCIGSHSAPTAAFAPRAFVTYFADWFRCCHCV